MKIGIIGFGPFGEFTAKVLAPYGEIFVDAKEEVPEEYHEIAFAELADMDIVILAIPLEAYENILKKLHPLLNPETVVVDVCSVKVKSRDIMLETLKGHENIMVTHPLFGPQSAEDGVAGHDFIVAAAIGENAKKYVKFCEEVLKMRVLHFTAEQHDHIMAYVHALTFFVARGLSNLRMPDLSIQTPSFDMLRDLIDLDSRHTEELFLTIQQGNPYGEQVRRQLIETFEELEAKLALKHIEEQDRG
ncbi:MAG: prephenate dehydrogenase/arogenate dehydrogenase family protein [Micrococcaceae bacterium]